MSELKALIFDVDGTLAETERDAHLPAFNEAFAAYGLDWHWSETLYGELLQVTGGKERIRFYLDNYRPAVPEVPDLAAFIAQLHAAKTTRYVERTSTGRVPLRPGITRLLQEARGAGLRLAIATTTSLENVEALLVHSLAPDAMSWFEVFGAGDMVAAKKPAPDVYHYVLTQMDLDPNACLAFEDSANGLRAASGAGIPTLITESEYTRGEDFEGALAVLDSLGEPAQPCRVLHGDIGDAAYVDVALLRHLARR